MPPVRHLLIGLLAGGLLWSLDARADSVQVTDSARQHFEAGVNFMQDPDGARYEEAYREFRAAYADSPSWKILGNLGIAAMKLERDGEAIEAFEKYLSEGGDQLDPAEHKQFARDLETLKTSVVWITVSSVPAGAMLQDERVPVRGASTINRYPGVKQEVRLGLRAGHHRIVAKLDGHVDAVWELDAQSGRELSHTFELRPVVEKSDAPAVTPPPSSAPEVDVQESSNLGLYVGLGVTGALAVGSGVTAILASGKKGEFDDANDGTQPGRAKELKDSGETLNLVADVLLGGAVVAGAVTTILYFMHDESPPPGGVEVSASWLPGGGGVSISGEF